MPLDKADKVRALAAVARVPEINQIVFANPEWSGLLASHVDGTELSYLWTFLCECHATSNDLPSKDDLLSRVQATDDLLADDQRRLEWALWNNDGGGRQTVLEAIDDMFDREPPSPQRGRDLLRRLLLDAEHSRIQRELSMPGIDSRGDAVLFAEAYHRLREIELLGGAAGNLLEDMSLEDFMAQDHRIEFLVEGLMPRGEPGILSGKMKTCKSAVGLDLYLSLASGKSFLDHFVVTRPVRVGIISCESGKPVLQDTLRRIAITKGLNLDRLVASGAARISVVRPNLLEQQWLSAIEQFVRQHSLEAIIIDPVYLMTPGAEQNTLASMSVALGPLSDICRRTGCGVLLVHHNRKNDGSGRRFSKPSLEEIVGSGYGEFARYWVLLSKRNEWDEIHGDHELHLVAGSNFYGGHYRWLDIHEGSSDDPGGRVWQVKVRPPGESDAERQARQFVEDKAWHERIMRTVYELQQNGGLPASKSKIVKAAGGNREKAFDAIKALKESGALLPAIVNGRIGVDLPAAEEGET